MPYSGQSRLKPVPVRPIADINTTPLIDVMLVLLIMMIITIPLPPHSLEVDLPPPGPLPPGLELDPTINKVVVTTQGNLLWNGQAVDAGGLTALVAASTRLPKEPQLHFEPEPTAGYEESAKTIQLIKAAGATRFAFVGNQRYRTFDRDR